MHLKGIIYVYALCLGQREKQLKKFLIGLIWLVKNLFSTEAPFPFFP